MTPDTLDDEVLLAVFRNVIKITDNRPESFLKLLEERAKEFASDYPYTKHNAFEWLWAITSTLEGTELARQDWETKAVGLDVELAIAKEEIQRLKYRLNHMTEDDVEECRQGKHEDCGA